jgi:hypothetical protein
MNKMFDDLKSAQVWLRSHGWKQVGVTAWWHTDGIRYAETRLSPADDGVVSVIITRGTRRRHPLAPDLTIRVRR